MNIPEHPCELIGNLPCWDVLQGLAQVIGRLNGEGSTASGSGLACIAFALPGWPRFPLALDEPKDLSTLVPHEASQAHMWQDRLGSRRVVSHPRRVYAEHLRCFIHAQKTLAPFVVAVALLRYWPRYRYRALDQLLCGFMRERRGALRAANRREQRLPMGLLRAIREESDLSLDRTRAGSRPPAGYVSKYEAGARRLDLLELKARLLRRGDRRR